MLLFQCIFNNDEFLSDTFKIETVYDDTIYKVQSKYINVADAGQVAGVDYGDDEAGDAPGGERVLDVVHNAGLQEYHMNKKEFMAYCKAYFAKVVKYLEENGKQDRVDIFKKGATAFIKYIMPKFGDDALTVYCGSSKTEDQDELTGAICISLWENDEAEGPVFYFFKDGLKEVKC